MNPALLQKQLKDNATDMTDFYKELKQWGEEMKRKQDKVQPSSHIPAKKSNPAKIKKPAEVKEKSKQRVGLTDYSAWEKFDADAECEKVDYNENEDSDLTDEFEECSKTQAYAAKEKGNEFVKASKWDEAIKCYSKAINIHSYDPVFYANRALCFLKQQEYIKSELDCTMSIRLDSTYVKAFQRRAAAREGLGKLEEAEIDLLTVLKLEPNNKESANKLDALRKKLQYHNLGNDTQRPVSRFTASRNKNIADMKRYGNNEGRGDEIKVEQKRIPDVIPVKTVVKPMHLRSKKPLKRIEIQEIDEVEVKEEIQQFSNVRSSTLNIDDLKVIERQQPVKVDDTIKEKKQNIVNNNNEQEVKIDERKNSDKKQKVQNNEEVKIDERKLSEETKQNNDEVKITVPTNSVQFYSQWRQLKPIDRKYDFLKLINPENLPHIFKGSLEINVFSEILEILVKCFIKNNEEVFSFLKFFAEMKRFSALIMFLSDNEKNYLLKLFDYERQRGERSKEEIDLLLQKYEL